MDNKVKFGAGRSSYFEENRLIIVVEFKGPTFNFDEFAKSGALDEIGKAFKLGSLLQKQPLTFTSEKRSAAFLFADAEPRNSDLLPSVLEVNQQLQKGSYAGYPNVRVLPNWYGAGADNPVDGTGGGGPGEPPRDANLQPPDQPQQMLKFNLPKELEVMPSKGNVTQAVDVFILDSVPWIQGVTQSGSPTTVTTVQTRFDSNTCYGLLKAKFDHPGFSAGSFEVLPSNNNNPRLPPENMIPGKDGLAVPDRYDPTFAQDMYDHGLFIAGIIYSMAQDYQADLRIHLIETTNAYGVTSFEAILDALNLVQLIIQKNKLPFVVNMSLVILTPAQAALQYRCDADEVLALSYQILADIQWDTNNMQRGVLVASAGNNNLPPPTPPGVKPWMNRPDPLFPAAAQGVIGVGALTKDFHPAPYSNQADYPANGTIADERIWTFGGDYDPNDSNTYRQGMLGLSSDPKSTGGLQWWAGTSFASGVVSGTLAVLLSQNLPQTAGQKATDYLFSKCTTHLNEASPHSQITPDDLGRILNVTQG